MPRNLDRFGWSGGLPACIAPISVIEDSRPSGNKLHHFGEVVFNRCLTESIGALHPALKRQSIAIDCKRLRSLTCLELGPQRAE